MQCTLSGKDSTAIPASQCRNGRRRRARPQMPPAETRTAAQAIASQSVPRLLELGETPVPRDEQVRGVPGMEGVLLRRRDLPRVVPGAADAEDPVPVLLAVADTVARCAESRAVILNTAASMEGPALARIAPRMRGQVFAVGPLHARPAARQWRREDDDGCTATAWLDGHEDRSVVYMNLGSLTTVSSEQLDEFLHGLVADGYAFLCVLRPDMLRRTTPGQRETILAAGGGDRAMVVEWAVHRDLHYVLGHRAVGCFLTHAGWNSTLEAAVEGVPVVCWPYFADQQTVSRFVGEVWKTGLDMKDVCDRAVVARMVMLAVGGLEKRKNRGGGGSWYIDVREAMEAPEIRAAAHAMARQLRLDVAQGGSSASRLERLVAFITELSAEQTPAEDVDSSSSA